MQSTRMDLLSLPNEMFFSVLKYVSFPRRVALRRLNHRVDSIAKRVGLDRFDVSKFEVNKGRKEGSGWAIRIVQSKKQRLNTGLKTGLSGTITHNCAGYFDLHEAIRKRLRSIRITQMVSLRKMKFGECMVAILKRNKESVRKCQYIEFHELEFRHRARTSLFSLFPAITSIEIDETSATQKLFNKETILNFPTNSLYINIRNIDDEHTKKILNNDLLANVIRKGVRIDMNQLMSTSYTIQSIIQLLQSPLTGLDGCRHWFLGKIANTNREIQDALNEADGIEFELATTAKSYHSIRAGSPPNNIIVELMGINTSESE